MNERKTPFEMIDQRAIFKHFTRTPKMMEGEKERGREEKQFKERNLSKCKVCR
jgi:hypothetical protein